MIFVTVTNAILCTIVVAVIVGGLVWAIATQHRDRPAMV